MLPSWIQDRISGITAGFSASDLAQAYHELSRRYRMSSDRRGFRSTLETVAYIAARLPATFACVQRCLDELPAGYLPSSALDVGCGPGTATLACLDRFQEIQSILVEENSSMIKLGQQLLPSGRWIPGNILGSLKLPKADLVLFSYVLNEIPLMIHQQHVIDNLWAATNDYLLIITAGTPDGFNQLRQVRQYLIEQGAAIVAPCPHALACPMQGQDWCHFSVRLSRSGYHKTLKGAKLGHEDEKFSYLLASKRPTVGGCYQRVVKQPQHRSGHGQIDLCTGQGQLSRYAYSKSKSTCYRQLKQLSWGDRISRSL